MSILERISTRFALPFIWDWAKAVFAAGVAADYVGAESFIEHPEQFARLAISKGWLGDIRRPDVAFIGKKPANYECQKDELEIQQWNKAGNNFDHFVSAENGVVVYDPWSANGSDTVRFGKCIGKRVFKVIA